MNRKYHNLLKALTEADHPFPDVAVKRAMFAERKKMQGAGLSRIPLDILQDEISSKKEAENLYQAINDSVEVEASYLARKDVELESLYGLDVALSYFYQDSKVQVDTQKDIINKDLGIDLTPEIPTTLVSETIPREFKQLFEEIHNTFSNDFVAGMDRGDKDRKRLATKMKKLVIDIGGIG